MPGGLPGGGGMIVFGIDPDITLIDFNPPTVIKKVVWVICKSLPKCFHVNKLADSDNFMLKIQKPQIL